MSAGSQSADVIVIGAGAAGLAAAAALSDARCSVLVLEARDRIGGRIWTLEDPHMPLAAELGAEFIHGRAPATLELLRRAGGIAVDAPASHWFKGDSGLQPAQELFEQVSKLMQPAADLKQDVSIADWLERPEARKAPPAARQRVRMMVEGFDGADPARASTLAIAAEWSGSTAQEAQFRPLGGYGPLLHHLTDRIQESGARLLLGCVVEEIRWQRGAVEVIAHTSHGAATFTARGAVVTLPLGVLKDSLTSRADGVRFTPPLEPKRAALDGLEPAQVVKAVLDFESAFWEQADGGRYCNATFFHSPEARLPTFWTSLPYRTARLVAWAGGPKAVALAGVRDDALAAVALESLGEIFGAGEIRARLRSVRMHHWQNDPYARGAYSYVVVGGGGAREALAKPLEDTLFFAGEAADDSDDATTVNGALSSGARAAREVLDAQARPS